MLDQAVNFNGLPELTHWEVEARLIYSIIVAGKSANFADAALCRLIRNTMVAMPLQQLKEMIDAKTLGQKIREARIGNYTKFEKCIRELIKAVRNGLSIRTCQPVELEAIHGIGPKTSRFFVMWTRPNTECAALDVHILRWLRGLGYEAPRQTPQSKKKYAELERAFLQEAKKRGKTARQLDEEIWTAGAGRTQLNSGAQMPA